MMPVEQTSTSLASMPSASAAAAPIASASAQARRAGAGIGVARIDDDRRRPAAVGGEPLATELDRRRGELVLGEDGRARHRLAVVGREQRHVEAAPLDPGVAAGGDEAFGGGDAHG